MPTNNVLLTPKVFAKLVLMELGGALNIARNMSRAITPEFAKKTMKIGSTVEVRKPYRFIAGEGLAWDPQALTDQTTTVTVSSVPHVHWQWDSVERTMDVREAMELYTGPAAFSLANKINADAATFAAQNALNSVGTPGTAPTSQATYLAAGDILCELGLPEEQSNDLKLVVNRRMSTAFVNGTVAYFNPTGLIGGQLQQGHMLDSMGYKVLRDQTINTHTVGTFTTAGLVNGAQQAEGGNNATMTLVTDTWTAGVMKKGDKFVIGSSASATANGVESVHPQTRVSTGRQQTFTFVADATDAAGAMSPVIAPAITPSGQYQNVNIAAPDNGIITIIGTTGAVSRQGLLLHKNAFCFVSVKLAEFENGTGVKSIMEYDEETGLYLRYNKYADGDQSVEKHRFDGLVGYGNLYREMAVVVQS